jgi:hypothetical protein
VGLGAVGGPRILGLVQMWYRGVVWFFFSAFVESHLYVSLALCILKFCRTWVKMLPSQASFEL